MKKYLQIYKKSLLQILGMGIAGFISKNFTFYYLSAGLLLVLLFFPAVSLLLVRYTDKLLHLIGMLFKRMLLGILFLIVVTPMACIMRLFKPKKTGGVYVSRASDTQLTDMRKMW